MKNQLLLILTCALATACHSGGVKPTTIVSGGNAVQIVAPTASPLKIHATDAKGESTTLTAKALTSYGANDEARFSPDGHSVLFISRSRPNHEHAQVYILDLARMVERRLTFHDGDDRTPAWIDSDHFVFASPTDERKEMPEIVDKLMRQYGPPKASPSPAPFVSGTELYAQSLQGDIERLTHSPGADTDPEPFAKQHRLYFASDRDGGKMRLFVRESGNFVRITDTNGASDRHPRVSPDGQWLAWTRTTADGTRTIFVAPSRETKKSARALLSDGADSIEASWTPNQDGVVFSRKNADGFFEIDWSDLSGQCRKKLASVDSDLRNPSITPDGKQIAFTAAAKPGELTQIYMMEFHSPKDCEPSTRVTPSPSPTPTSTPLTTPSPSASPQAASPTP